MKINLSDRERIMWEYTKHILSFVFQVLLFLFLVVLLLREFFLDKVNTYVNINWFMLVVVVFGALSILFPPNRENEMKDEERNITGKDILLITGLGILGAIIIFLKLKSLGWIGGVIALLGGIIIQALSWLLLTEKENKEMPVTGNLRFY